MPDLTGGLDQARPGQREREWYMSLAAAVAASGCLSKHRRHESWGPAHLPMARLQSSRKPMEKAHVAAPRRKAGPDALNVMWEREKPCFMMPTNVVRSELPPPCHVMMGAAMCLVARNHMDIHLSHFGSWTSYLTLTPPMPRTECHQPLYRHHRHDRNADRQGTSCLPPLTPFALLLPFLAPRERRSTEAELANRPASGKVVALVNWDKLGGLAGPSCSPNQLFFVSAIPATR